jgi:hypothetical protein
VAAAGKSAFELTSLSALLLACPPPLPPQLDAIPPPPREEPLLLPLAIPPPMHMAEALEHNVTATNKLNTLIAILIRHLRSFLWGPPPLCT